jgi:hypothetical protein
MKLEEANPARAPVRETEYVSSEDIAPYRDLERVQRFLTIAQEFGKEKAKEIIGEIGNLPILDDPFDQKRAEDELIEKFRKENPPTLQRTYTPLKEETAPTLIDGDFGGDGGDEERELEEAPFARPAEITGDELRTMLLLDPNFALKEGKEIRVVTFADLSKTGITGVSDYFTFAGRDEEGRAVSFQGCRNLKTVGGTYHGSVDLGPRISKGSLIPCNVGEFSGRILKPDAHGMALYAQETTRLKTLKGTFPGGVNLEHSQIREVDVEIEGANEEGIALNLRDARGTIHTRPEKTRRTADTDLVENTGKIKGNGQGIALLQGKFKGGLDLAGAKINGWGKVIITKPDNRGHKARMTGTTIGKFLEEPHLEAHEIQGLENASGELRRELGNTHTSSLGILLAELRRRHPNTYKNGRFEMPESPLLTRPRLEAAILVMKANSIPARLGESTDYLPKFAYSALESACHDLIDWEKGGLTPNAIQEIIECRGAKNMGERIVEASKFHKEFIRSRSMVVAVALGGIDHSSKETDRFINPKTKVLTKEGMEIFGKQSVVQSALAHRHALQEKSMISILLDRAKDRLATKKPKGLAQDLLDDDAEARRNTPIWTRRRVKKLWKSARISGALILAALVWLAEPSRDEIAQTLLQGFHQEAIQTVREKATEITNWTKTHWEGNEQEEKKAQAEPVKATEPAKPAEPTEPSKLGILGPDFAINESQADTAVPSPVLGPNPNPDSTLSPSSPAPITSEPKKEARPKEEVLGPAFAM